MNGAEQVIQHISVRVEKPSPSIKLLTYNVFLRPPGIHSNADDYKNERCDLIIKEVSRFDIVCFQELFGFMNLRKWKVRQTASKLGFVHQAASPNPNYFSTGSAVDGGLVTMSRYPIVRQAFQEFPYAHKGILYTKIDINGKILHLFNTHFQASYVGREENVVPYAFQPKRATVLTRIDQMKCFRKFLNRTLQGASPSDLVLLAGDFNVDALLPGFPTRFLEFYPELHALFNKAPLYSEYDCLMHVLSSSMELIDLVRARFGESKVTYGDTHKHYDGSNSPAETCLTSPEDQQSNQCLDYILQLKLGNPDLWVDNVQIEKFLVAKQIFSQLSDHYGLSCEILGQNDLI